MYFPSSFHVHDHDSRYTEAFLLSTAPELGVVPEQHDVVMFSYWQSEKWSEP